MQISITYRLLWCRLRGATAREVCIGRALLVNLWVGMRIILGLFISGHQVFGGDGY